MNNKLTKLIGYLYSQTQKIDMEALTNFLKETELDVIDVADHKHFHEENYRRNLIAHSEWFDMLVVCWRAGQFSQIHDHAGSSCGFKILEGAATERIFKKTSGTFVKEISTRTYEEGQICSAYDSDVHQIVNNGDGNLVTLHVYSPPLKMNFYSVAIDEPGIVHK